jgi:protein-S-isoprenylcysteine O-methyltransferase Ste14
MMGEIGLKFRFGRMVWTVLVTFYFLVFFRNFFADALPGSLLLPVLFSYVFVLWLSVEYYVGSPFFQSGVVEPSALWRGVFAFFVYPFFGYVAADFIWWHWTQVPLPGAVFGVLGLAVFSLGVYVRLSTLFGIAGLDGHVKPGQAQRGFPEKKFCALPLQQVSRHPRHFAIVILLVGAALTFNSWGGLVLAGVLGLPLILVQVRHEDKLLRTLLKSEGKRYFEQVPKFWPRLRRPSA